MKLAAVPGAETVLPVHPWRTEALQEVVLDGVGRCLWDR